MSRPLTPRAVSPDPIPEDDTFLELLFGTMCQNLVALPGENFVDRACRWTEALRFTAGLKPRNPQEWLQAADVTMKQFSAVYSLVMQRRKGISTRQRLKHEQEYRIQVKATHDALLRYDLLRKPGTS